MSALAIYGEGGGKGGGGSSRTPREAPNTLRSTSKARILDMLGEGPIVGLANGHKSIFIDETPLQNDDGSYNYDGVTVHTRDGEPDQAHIAGFPAVETAQDVSSEVTYDLPIVRTVNNLDANAARVTVQIPALSNQNVENGDLNGASVTVAIDVRPDGGNWSTARTDTISGKTISPYQRAYRVELPGAGPWQLRVRRVTADSDSSTLRNQTFWATYTEIIDAKLTYPDSALVGLEVDAQQFGNQIPSRAYDVKGLIIRVPSNYNATTRTYSGLWDGSFKLAWTDNPAWVFMDLATSQRYGAGLDNVDKWGLYQIAQYCDELVPNGYGQEEPRFTFNTMLASREEAITALNTLASAFRGMTYWGANTVMAAADMPSDPVKLVTPANVIDGEFEYSGTALKARHSVALVSWNDPEDGYRLQVEVIEDADAIQQFGWKPTEVTAPGCTSRGQAHRLGKWMLYSERAETETVTYTAAVDHADIRPGDIIKLSDPTTAGARLAGRLRGAGLESLQLDAVPEQVSGSDWFIDVLLPTGGIERRAVAAFVDNFVDLAAPLSAVPLTGAVWMLSSQSVEPRLFRVASVSEQEQAQYQVTAIEHDPTKYARVELGLDLPVPDTSLLPTGPVTSPLSINVESWTYIAGGTEHQGLTISWTPSDDPRVTSYIAEVQGPNDVRWRTVYTGTGVSFDITDAVAGEWMVRVRAVTGIGTLSPWVALTTNVAGLLLPVPPDSVDIDVGTFTITLRPRGAYPGQVYEFWRSNVALELDQINSNAVRLTVSTDLTDTELNPGTTYFYYIRGANAYGVSSWYPVQATTEMTPEKILQVLSDQIREEHLYSALGERIDKIDGPETLDGSVSQRIAAEAEEVRGELIDGFAAEAQARAQALAEETENRTVALTNLSETVESEFDLLGLEINAIAAAYDATSASIYTMTQIRINEAEVVATQVNQLSGRVDDNESLILNVQQITTNQYSSLATQVGILSARLDARPSLNSGFEPGADFDAWSATSGNTITAQTSGVYSGLQSALITSSTASADPNSGGVRRIIEAETTAEFAGYQIRLSVYAKQPDSGASAEFALAYQIAGESVQWQRFTPTAEWAFHDVVIDVPAGVGSVEHAISVWGDTSGAGGGVELDRLMVTFAEIDIPEIAATIEQIQQALVNQEEALAQELTGFETQLGENSAAIQGEITARTTLTDSLANSVQTLQASTQDNAAAITAEREAWTSETEALTELIEQQSTQIAEGSAAVEELSRTSATEDEYLASVQRVLSAAKGVDSAAYKVQTTALINTETALVERIETLQVAFEDELASVQEQTQVQYNQTTERLEAMWTLRIDNNGRVSGIGLADDGEASSFAIRADRFYVTHPDNNSEVIPLILDSGQVLINDALINQLLFTKLRSSDGSLVFEDGKLQAEYIAADQLEVEWANIQNASISNAQIENGAITNAKIYNGAITRAKIGDAEVDTLQIRGEAVTVPVSSFTAGATSVPASGIGGVPSWKTIQNIYIEASDSPVSILATAIFRINWYFSSTTGYAQLLVRLLDAETGQELGQEATVDESDGQQQSYRSGGTVALSYRFSSVSSGRTIAIQAAQGAGTNSASYSINNRSMQALTTKR
ncbi:phage tail protein [Vreelandella glaciei]|uniref:host specificity protein J n=1 Tax=Vreelandella glaciei TaxID=186761 RepID=UPI0030023860